MVRIRFGDEERRLGWEEWERQVRQGRIPADALVCIEALTQGRFVPAGTLGTYRELRDEGAIAWRTDFLGGPAPLVTALLVGVQVRIWWLARLPEVQDPLVAHGANWTAPLLEDGQPWRLVTMGLLHTDLAHLALNMVWLAYSGWSLEKALGRANLVALFLASVVAGSLLSAFASPTAISLGASGGIFGLVAASVVFGLRFPHLVPSRARSVFGVAMIPYFLLMLWSGWMSEGTDNWSHLGGAIAGGTLAWALDPVPLQRRAHWNHAWHGAIALCIAGVFGFTAAYGPRVAVLSEESRAHAALIRARHGAPRDPWRMPERVEVSLTVFVPSGWRPGTTGAGDPGWRSPSPYGERAWSVREISGDAPRSVLVLFEDWQEGLRLGWPDASVGPLAGATVGGWPGAAARVTARDGRTVFEWRAATRGLWAIVEVWQVDARRADRLAPLRDRLRSRVSWRDPAPLARARERAAENPVSRANRAELADALAGVGDVEGATALYEALAAEDPGDPAPFVGLLRLSGWYPERTGSGTKRAEHALTAHPTSSMAIAVAEWLESTGETGTAVALLDLAWARFPGDRDLRRARRSRGLDVSLPDSDPIPPLDLATARALALTRATATDDASPPPGGGG